MWLATSVRTLEAMDGDAERLLAQGNQAPAAGQWTAAREVEESAEALDGLGEARWWLGETHEGVRRLEADAADPIDGERLARGVHERARNEGDVDLQLCALSQISAALIRQGRVPEGLANLGEAMAGALGGEGRHRDTVVFTSCTTMIACVTCAANESAVQWIRASDRSARSYGSPFLYAECRTLYGTLLIDTGDWVQAEEELQAALDTAPDRSCHRALLRGCRRAGARRCWSPLLGARLRSRSGSRSRRSGQGRDRLAPRSPDRG